MRKYLVILRQSILDSLAYGPVAFVWVLIELVEVIAPLAIWYGAIPLGSSIGGYSKLQMLYYYALVVIVRGFTMWYVWSPVSIQIRNGDFSNLLVKPLPAIIQIIVGEVGWKIIRTVVQLPLIIGISALLIFYLPGHDYSMNIAFLASLILGSLVSLLISSCFAALSFWITDMGGFNGLYFFLSYILSGELAPLSVYPQWFGVTALSLPFRYIVSFPLEIFFKKLDLQSILYSFGAGIVWTLFLFWLTRYLWRRGITNYQAYGK